MGSAAQLESKKKLLVERIAALRVGVAQASSLDSPFLLSSCRFSESDLQELKTAFDAGFLTTAEIDEISEQWLQKISPPHPELRKALESVELPSSAELPPQPEWKRALAKHRSFF